MKRVASVLIPILTAVLPACSDPVAPVDFSKYERSVFSQHGEDGVIEKIFELIEPTGDSPFVIEFGAHDGVTNSNARNLILNKGWSALLIEGDEKRAAELEKNYADYPNVTTLQAWIYPGNIEILFEENGAPREPDLMVIDIDSNDYYVWRVMHEFRPKVVMIEAHPAFHPPQLMVINFHPMNYWTKGYSGASLQSLYNLAKKKGYELIYSMSYGPNAFFVDKKYYDRFGIEDNSPATLFQMWKAPKSKMSFSKGKEYLHVDAFKIKKRYILDR